MYFRAEMGRNSVGAPKGRFQSCGFESILVPSGESALKGFELTTSKSIIIFLDDPKEMVADFLRKKQSKVKAFLSPCIGKTTSLAFWLTFESKASYL